MDTLEKIQELQRMAKTLETMLTWINGEDVNENVKIPLRRAAWELSSQIYLRTLDFRWDSAKSEVYFDDIPF